MECIKICTVCKQPKPQDEFSSHRGRRDGKDSRCRECNRAAVKVHQCDHPDLACARGARYRQRHPDREKERHAKYARENKAHLRDLARAWRRENPDKVKLYQRKAWIKWYAKNKHRVIARVKAWQEDNRERVRASARKNSRKRYWADPQKSRLASIRGEAMRRAKKHGVKILQVDLEHILERDGMRCHICHRRVSRKSLSFDHLIPLAKGGEHSLANLRVAHRHYNQIKHTKVMPVQQLLFP